MIETKRRSPISAAKQWEVDGRVESVVVSSGIAGSDSRKSLTSLHMHYEIAIL